MILVTGGTGLVGAHLLAKLVVDNDLVRAIKRASSNLDAIKNVFSYYHKDVDSFFNKIEWIDADVVDVPSLVPVFVDVTYVYHCAAVISFNPKAYRKMRKVNIEGTANIVNLSLEQGVKKFCFVSSIAAVGRSMTGKPIKEESEWQIENSNYGYAITKYGAELEVWRGTQEGLDAVIVNPGIILGAGFWDSGSGSLFEKASKGIPFYTEGVTGYVGVEDVIQCMLQLMDSNVVNERFILVAENRSYKQIFFELADALNAKTPTFKLKKWQTEIFWRFSLIVAAISRTKPILTKHSAASIHKRNNFDSSKIRRTLNYKFEDIEDTIKRVSKFYLEEC
ncbi:NAD-dependent epimerase/dehydratase family protein [Urechidicola sp. KH5]